jgi:hypothetical protein
VTLGRDSVNPERLNVSNLIRVVGTALVLSTLSFAAGVAGDLSLADPPNFGERVVLRLPPEIPADAPRAAPLPRLVAVAAASEPARPRFAPIAFEPLRLEPLAWEADGIELAALTGEAANFSAKPDPRRKDA